ncbi:MAG: hypothetical protein ACYDH1_02135 [Anaerolineaceae bacterium]
MDIKFLRNVVLKALSLFIIFNLILMALPTSFKGDQLSIYNHLVPGRERFPFGETPRQAYNFSLYDVDAMFASHELDSPKSADIKRVFVMGDSSVWGTLLKPEETLSGQLNALSLSCKDNSLYFYNLGYPTISVTKDLMLMQRSLAYQPDAVVWLTTLEAFPLDKQLASPLAANNQVILQPVIHYYGLPLTFEPQPNALLDKSLWGRRRAIADWIRLQLYGIMYAATGVDQIYPDYTPAAWDLEADQNYGKYKPPTLPKKEMLFQALPAAKDMLGDIPLILVNEPIMISTGQNSDLRYNYFYPRWAYDQYRVILSEVSIENQIPLIDAWNWVDATSFTNSAIHMNAKAERAFADLLSEQLLSRLCD